MKHNALEKATTASVVSAVRISLALNVGISLSRDSRRLLAQYFTLSLRELSL